MKEVKLESGVIVKGVTLLTAGEARNLPDEIRAIKRWWWLSSPDPKDRMCAIAVDGSGYVWQRGYDVKLVSAVRPVLVISLEASKLKIGDTVTFGEKEFEIISDTKALCTDAIGDCVFRKDSRAIDANDYKKSDIKVFVEHWYEEIVSKLSVTVEKSSITLNNGVIVVGATLLTVEEAEKLPRAMLASKSWWWLRSPGDGTSRAAYVSTHGDIDVGGFVVDSRFGYVRPALVINLETSSLKVGDTFVLGEDVFDIVSSTRALCTKCIDYCAFREDGLAVDANIYEKSDVKVFVEHWYEKLVNELPVREEKLYTLEGIANIIRDIPFSSFHVCESSNEIAELIVNIVDRGGK